ncbi:probable UDP-N-acetylglucosamine--peptide N-acetylglucosaminyltransferase SEC isoform X2 [Miscanthus floridulus]|uniref:probable UDP-N-acetylglucosamine--peptide N-acetylglucosaminyltransferase SEC isoform X2 n=1 Tax=Miscanthus floridulus TaxID=154761 RepID=UPI003458DF3E
MLSICGRGGGAVAAGEEQRAPYPPLPPYPRPLQLGATIDALILNQLQVDERTRLDIAQQSYNAGDFRAALEQSNAIYRENPRRLENLLLLGAVYFQLREFDMCIAKNEEAIAIQPNFPEFFNNMASAWREKGDIDHAIQCYEHAIQLRPTFADAFSNLANAYTRKGNLIKASTCCHQALALNPRLVDAYCNLGDVLKAQGSYRDAYNCFREVVSILPSCASAWCNIAGLFMQWGDFNKAAFYYKEAIKFKPSFYDAHLNLGNLYKAVGMCQDAIICYQNAAQAWPQNAVPYGSLGDAYYEQGQLDLAILSYRHATNCNPSYVEAYNNLGNALKGSGKCDEAICCYQTCLALQPNHPQALTNLGNVYMERSMLDIAASHFMAVLAVTTGLSAPYNNLAMIYKQQGSYDNAISCYNEVLRVDPLAADGLVNRGNTLKEAGRVSEAIQDYLQAAAIRPTMAEAHANLAYAGLLDSAIVSYKQALQLRPDFPEVTCNLLHTLQCVCDWDGREEKLIKVEGIIRQQIQMSLLPSMQPFHAMALPIDPTLELEISKKYADHYSLVALRFGLPAFTYPSRTPIKTDDRTSRLRIGYVSSDFGNHPLSHLMGSVFGMHNKDIVEVFCYALSRDDGTEWRQRIKGEAEHFTDVSTMPSDMIAKVINEDKIQILINLNGYTKGARNEIFAMQPAPIQVSYMGFPSTTGASYIDYLITDEFVSLLKYSHIYLEKLVHLPYCYFVSDYKQKNQEALDPVCPHKRADYGLPEDKFIFACFNQLYKMDPDIFETWCNILKCVSNSVLWLLRFPAAGEMRLRAYAISKGVRADQIIFTDVAAKTEHIRRSVLADLFLDTPLCNGHTTGTDVLWAGLPMITLALQKMATRVAGSLCLATRVGEEMIVNSLKEYEERAVFLATHPSKLQALTNRLKAVRMTCPLFDTSRWVRNLERAYLRMWHLYCSGSHPQHFKVVEDDTQFPFDG